MLFYVRCYAVTMVYCLSRDSIGSHSDDRGCLLFCSFVEVEVDRLRRVEFVSIDLRFGSTFLVGFSPQLNATGETIKTGEKISTDVIEEIMKKCNKQAAFTMQLLFVKIDRSTKKIFQTEKQNANMKHGLARGLCKTNSVTTFLT